MTFALDSAAFRGAAKPLLRSDLGHQGRHFLRRSEEVFNRHFGKETIGWDDDFSGIVRSHSSARKQSVGTTISAELEHPFYLHFGKGTGSWDEQRFWAGFWVMAVAFVLRLACFLHGWRSFLFFSFSLFVRGTVTGGDLESG
ncbi:hypothetical protein BJ508DRAFT_335062 [Ascobolus immersus RN42]|uniref:Uncharacterized protein n=1 Tax=Ascobolus immersus RN42 TaxID=1160509 RepID=A0A3N4HH72_ASCIM|nr:hypothetical protein BJ508DRAFT_335062 [Ascobolus immersus RN42]